MARDSLIRFRRGNQTEWLAINNPNGAVLAAGEPGFDSVNNILKVGDGTTPWSSLSPVNSGLDTSIDGFVASGSINIINANENNIDFQVKGDSDSNLIYADASTDRVGVGTNTPLTKFHIHATNSEGTILSQTDLDYSFAGFLVRNQDNVNVFSAQYCNSGVAQTGLRDTILIGSRESGVPVKFYQGKETTNIIGANGAFEPNNERIIFDVDGNTTLTAASGQQIFASGQSVMIPTASPSGSTLLIGRHPYQASIKAEGSGEGTSNNWLVMDSAGLGNSCALNYFTNDDVLLAYGGGNVAVGTASPGSHKFRVKGGSTAFDGGNVIINDDGGNYDFRVEGDADENLLFCDASLDAVRIGNSSDGSVGSKLHIYEVNKTNSTYSRTINSLGRAYSTTDGTYYHVGLNSRAEKYLSASTTDGGYCIGVNAVPVIYSTDGTNTLAEVAAFRCNPSINSAASGVTVTNAYDIKTIPYFQGTNNTITNHYGLYLGDAGLGGTTPTNEYGVYQDNTAAKNYFGGNVGINTNSPSQKLDINSSGIRIRDDHTPASASAAGNKGEIVWDSDYVYVCVATNTWKRSALSTW